MRCHESDALYTVDLIDSPDEICKAVARGVSVRIHILAQQHDFYYSVCCKTLYLIADIAEHTALFAASGVRHYAVGAEIVASVRYIDKSLMTVHAHRLHLIFCDVGIVVYDRTHAAAGLQPLFKEFREFRDVLGPENYVHP